MKFWGYFVSKDGIKTDMDKISRVCEWPKSCDSNQLQSSLGLCGCCQHYVDNYDFIFNPLYRLLCKGSTWEWSMDSENAIKSLKVMLTQAPILTKADLNISFFLDCGASDFATRCVLGQGELNGEGERPVDYYSKSLCGVELNYSMTDKELLSVVLGVKKIRQ